MPVNESLDQLFRSKETERQPDLSQVQQHWQQMQQLLPTLPAAAPKTGKPVVLKWLAGSMLVVGVVAAIWLLNRPGTAPPETAMAQPAAEPETMVPPVSNTPVATVTAPPAATPVITPAVTQPRQTAPVAVRFAPKPAMQTLPAHNDAESFDRLYIQLSKSPQMFTVEAGADTVLKCAEGTRVKIPANVFTDHNGQRITGSINLIVQEYYRYDNSNGLPVAVKDGKKQITAGMVKVDAYRADEKLKIEPGQSIEIQMHPAIDKSYKNKNAVVTGDLLPAAAQPETLTTKTISTLGWISEHSAENDARPRTNLVVRFDKQYNPQKFISQLAFTNIQAVMPGYIDGNEITFSNVPVGETVFLVSLGTVDNKHLSCIKKIVIGKDTVADLRFTETSAEKYKQQSELLGSLPVKE
jgi:hypothetical protein